MLAVADAVSRDSAASETGPHGSAGVHLVGHSMGGLIAREAALLRTGRVLSLTLLGSGPGRHRRPARRVAAPAAGGPGPARGAGPATTGTSCARHRRADVAGPAWSRRPGRRAPTSTIIAFLCERTLQTCPVGLIVIARYLLTCPDRTDELAALTRPPHPGVPGAAGMVIYGENDDAWPPAAQDRMARRLHAERACIPGAAHSPAVEAPDTTARALTTFWNAAERRRPVSHSVRT